MKISNSDKLYIIREADELIAYFDWIRALTNQYKQLKNFYHNPSGEARPARNVIIKGKLIRICPTGQKLQKMGAPKGLPDVTGAWAERGFHGIYLEAKVGNNKCTAEQLDWIARLRDAGYFVHVCYGAEELVAVSRWYLKLK